MLLSSTTALHARSRSALVVTMSARFDRSVSSGVTKAIARQEAADIWRDYGVDIEWDTSTVEGAMHLDVVIASAKTEYTPSNSFSILGRTELDGDGAVMGPIRINYEAIEQLLENRSTTGVLMRERELGRALGRVLAHEVGHVLLGVPAFHDAAGLMRAAIPVDDLVQPERRGVQLAESSLTRLRERVSCAGDAGDDESGGGCGCRVRSVSVKD